MELRGISFFLPRLKVGEKREIRAQQVNLPASGAAGLNSWRQMLVKFEVINSILTLSGFGSEPPSQNRHSSISVHEEPPAEVSTPFPSYPEGHEQEKPPVLSVQVAALSVSQLCPPSEHSFVLVHSEPEK